MKTLGAAAAVMFGLCGCSKSSEVSHCSGMVQVSRDAASSDDRVLVGQASVSSEDGEEACRKRLQETGKAKCAEGRSSHPDVALRVMASWNWSRGKASLGGTLYDVGCNELP